MGLDPQRRRSRSRARNVPQVIDPAQLVALQREVDRVEFDASLATYLHAVLASTRDQPDAVAGRVAPRGDEPGPRGPRARRAPRPQLLHRRRRPRSRGGRARPTASASRPTRRATCPAATSARRGARPGGAHPGAALSRGCLMAQPDAPSKNGAARCRRTGAAPARRDGGPVSRSPAVAAAEQRSRPRRGRPRRRPYPGRRDRDATLWQRLARLMQPAAQAEVHPRGQVLPGHHPRRRVRRRSTPATTCSTCCWGCSCPSSSCPA